MTPGTVSKEQHFEIRPSNNYWDSVNSSVIIVFILIFYIYF